MEGKVGAPQMLTLSLLASRSLLCLGLWWKGPCGLRTLTTLQGLQDCDSLDDRPQAEGWLFPSTSLWLVVPLWSWFQLPLAKEGPFEEAVPKITSMLTHWALAGSPTL